MSYLFEARDVTKRYANHVALNKVSIAVEKGSIFGLLGPNGAGKTSLIRIINQITGPDEGELLFDGKALELNHTRQIGYLPEERGLYKKMKVGEQALYLAQLKGLSRKEALDKLHYWFKRFDISSWWNKKVEELSKGMQQKVQFIVTVIHEPRLLIFDEPFSGFDPINANILKEEILNLRDKGATIIFSTHNMGSVEEICDHIALINKSEKILDGKVSEVKENHKTNTYQVELENKDEILSLILPEKIEIISKELENNFLKMKIKTGPEFNSNDLLQILIDKGRVRSFHEVLPTMNDIFISNVQKSSGELAAIPTE